MTSRKIINQLPEVLRTKAQREFFDATFDQLFSPKNSQPLEGFVGRRTGGVFRPDEDNYKDEPTPLRTAYQLEPVMTSGADNGTVFFYEDLINYVQFRGGIVGNHNRLFADRYFSFAPPIDPDKFVNYPNYVWVENLSDIPVIVIDGVPTGTVDGESTVTVPAGQWQLESQAVFVLSVSETEADYDGDSGSGVFSGGADYSTGDVIVLDQGHSVTVTDVDGAGTVTEFSVTTSEPGVAVAVTLEQQSVEPAGGTGFELTPGYANVQLDSGQDQPLVLGSGQCVRFVNQPGSDQVAIVEGVGRSIELVPLDDFSAKSIPDHMVVERSLRDLAVQPNRLWALSNHWVHREVLDQLRAAGADLGTVSDSARSLKPILEFERRLEMLAGQTRNPADPNDFDLPPRFRVYDWQGIALDDEDVYPNLRNETLNTASPANTVFEYADPSADFAAAGNTVFANTLDNTQYTFQRPGAPRQPVPGYLFYRKYLTADPADTELSELRTQWKSSTAPLRQRVLQQWIGNGEQTVFVLSAVPVSGALSVSVTVEGRTLGTDLYSYDPASNSVTLLTEPPAPQSVIEIRTHTDQDLNSDDAHFEIPANLEKNPDNGDISEITWNQLNRHMVSIIENQTDFVGVGFGNNNNYRNSAKDTTLGTEILQTQSPLLKTMLMCADPDLDIVNAIRFSRSEYVRYKNKLVKFTNMLINEGFEPTVDPVSGIAVTQWLDEAINRVIKGREHATAFDHTLMLAWSNLYDQEQATVLAAQQSLFALDLFADLSDRSNVLYVYVDGVLQTIGTDYDIVSTDNLIQVQFAQPLITLTTVTFRLYRNISSAHVPATPAQLGIVQPTVPRRELDTTLPTPTEVIVGHDGSRTPVRGTVLDEVLLEFETRIYNGIPEQFRRDYDLPVPEAQIRPGWFRETGWSSNQWLTLLRPSFLLWATDQAADHRVNTTWRSDDPWTWNYTGVQFAGRTLQGSWRRIFTDFYDTLTPHETPWHMLGFAEQPEWWTEEYGSGPWGSSDPLWQDLEDGVIRSGSRSGVDPRYARPGLVQDHLPVDGDGKLLPTPLECIGYSGPGPTVTQQQARWQFGDQAPVEQVWRRSEYYDFDLSQALFLGRPAEFGEKLWDPEQFLRAPADTAQTLDLRNPLLRRRGNSQLQAHGESLSDDARVIRTGYQVWISSRLQSLNQDISGRLGQAVRDLEVRLGHRQAGFVNPDTLKVFVGGISTGSRSRYVLLPDENVHSRIHQSPALTEYFYGGVLIRTLDDGSYQVYGYDPTAGSFSVVPRVPSNRDSTITVGGESENFRVWSSGTAYRQGEVIRLNGVFYRALESHTATRFESQRWQRLSELPTVGGVTVTVRSQGDVSRRDTLEYGDTLPDTQSVFDFLLGWGDHLEHTGFVFETLNPQTGELETWRKAAEQFLFWVSGSPEPNSAIALSPAARGVAVTVKEGYPVDIQRTVNSVYSIQDRTGVVIDRENLTVTRDGRRLVCEPVPDAPGIYGFRVTTAETESILVVDNVTKFDDVVYDPVLGVRVPRLALKGERSADWNGRLEAGGYIISGDRLIPNYDHIADRFRDYHSTETELNDPAVSSIARHLIGFESRDYLDDMDIQDNNQFLFYRGMVREKGTVQAFNKIMRARTVSSGQPGLTVTEDWALRVGSYGSVCNDTTTEFLLPARQINSDSQTVVVNYDDRDLDDLDVPPGAVRITGTDDPLWLTRPTTTACAVAGDLWPTVTEPSTQLPNAGFVHLDDVDYSTFSLQQMFGFWDEPEPPTVNLSEGSSLLHVAETGNGWNVYTFVDDNREVEVESHFGTLEFSSDFADLGSAELEVVIGRDGTVRRGSVVNVNQASDIELPIDITDKIQDAGDGVVTNRSFPVVFSPDPLSGRGAVLELLATGGVLEEAKITNLGAGYGTPFTTTLTVPVPEPETGDFVRAQLRVRSNKSGNLQGNTVTVTRAGVGYVNPVTVPVAGGTGGTLRLTPDSQGSVTAALDAAGTGYSEPATFADQSFPDPATSSAQTSDPVISVRAGAGEPVELRFTFSLVSSGSAVFGDPTTQFIYNCDVGDVAVHNPTTNGRYAPNSQFEIQGLELAPRFGGGLGDTFDRNFNDVIITVTTDSNGRAASATLNRSFAVSVGSFQGDSFDIIAPSRDLLIATVSDGPAPGSTLDASTVRIDDPGIGFVDNTYQLTDQFGGRWSVTVANGRASAITVVSAGTGYPTARTTLNFDYGQLTTTPGTPGTAGTFSVSCDASGALTSVTVTSGGSGYPQDGEFETDPILVNGGSGGTVLFTVVGGSVVGAAIGEPGTNYANPRTFEFTDTVTQDPTTQTPNTQPAQVDVTVDRFGQVSTVSLRSSQRGLGYPGNGVFEIGSEGDTPGINSGSGARISYTVDSRGVMTGVEVVDRGSNYLVAETRTVTVPATRVLDRDYEFVFNSQPVVFQARTVNSPADLVSTINSAGIPGVDAVLRSGGRLLLRSSESAGLTVRAQSAEQAGRWRERTGVDWFGERSFELVLRSNAVVSVGDQQFDFDAGTGVADIVNSINDANIDNVLATIRDSRLVIRSTFDENFTVTSDSTAWRRDINTTVGQRYEPAQLVTQINRSTSSDGVQYQPGLVQFNRRLLGTEPSAIRRSIVQQFAGTGSRTQFFIGNAVSVQSVTVGTQTISSSDYSITGSQLVLDQPPAAGETVTVTAQYRVPDTGRFLPGRVLVQDPSSDLEFELFEYEFVGRGSQDQWYYVLSDTDGPVADGRFNEAGQLPDSTLLSAVFVSLRFDNAAHYEANRQLVELSGSPLVWIDQYTDGVANVLKVSSDETHRTQTPLVNSDLMRNAYVYDRDTLRTVIQLPVYDPLKGIVPGPADRNISYRTPVDPARYTNSDQPSLIDASSAFGRENVGELWWDTSTCAYYWYEQGVNRYRRDNWGRLVPGSSVDIYEWTRCSEPPAQYRGDGVPRNTTDFVVSQELDPVQQSLRVFYYYWVRDRVAEPDSQCSRAGRSSGRTLSSSEVARLIEDPTSQAFRWFAAISDTAFVFSGIDRVFADTDNVFQINYGRTNRVSRPHQQWQLSSQDDPFWTPPGDIWEKITDSLAGLTAAVDINSDQAFGQVLNNYPDAVTIDGSQYLPVPDPGLSETQRLGIQRRPRQTVFDDRRQARLVFVRTVNQALQSVRVRDSVPGWNQGFDTGAEGELWSWQDWWAPGRNRRNTVPVRQTEALSQLQTLENVHNGDVILVRGRGLGARRSLYEYDAAEDRFVLLYRERTRLVLDSAIYDSESAANTQLGVRDVQLRNIIEALTQRVFVQEQLSVFRDVFFAMVRHAFTEQIQLDWAFKTTYIGVRQPGRVMRKEPVLINEVTESVIDYVNEVKPYRSKLKNYVTVRSPETEPVPGSVTEIGRNSKLRMNFDRLQCTLSVTDIRLARSRGVSWSGRATLNRSSTHEPGGPYTMPSYAGTGIEVTVNGEVLNPVGYTVTDDGVTVTVTLAPAIESALGSADTVRIAVLDAVLIQTGAAGRAAARELVQQELTESVPLIVSNDFDDYFTDAVPVTEAEVSAVAAINRAVLAEMRCDFLGVTHLGWGLIPTVPWDFLSWNQYRWDGDAEFLITTHSANTDEPDFVLRRSQTQANYVSQFAPGTGHAPGDVITLSNSAQITVIDVAGGAVTQFEVSDPGNITTAGTELDQRSTTGTGTDFVLTPLAGNLAPLFADAEPIAQLPGNGLQTIFDVETDPDQPFAYAAYLWEVFVDGVPQLRNVDYFVVGDSTLVFEQAPPADSVISVFAFIDAGPLRNPQVNPGITQEKLPLQLLDTVSISVNRQETV